MISCANTLFKQLGRLTDLQPNDFLSLLTEWASMEITEFNDINLRNLPTRRSLIRKWSYFKPINFKS